MYPVDEMMWNVPPSLGYFAGALYQLPYKYQPEFALSSLVLWLPSTITTQLKICKQLVVRPFYTMRELCPRLQMRSLLQYANLKEISYDFIIHRNSGTEKAKASADQVIAIFLSLSILYIDLSAEHARA